MSTPSSLPQCHICNKTFTRAFTLTNHLRTHADEKPFDCQTCGKSFTRDNDRKVHQLTHTRSKRHLCAGKQFSNFMHEPCGRSFSRKTTMLRHLAAVGEMRSSNRSAKDSRAVGSHSTSTPSTSYQSNSPPLSPASHSVDLLSVFNSEELDFAISSLATGPTDYFDFSSPPSKPVPVPSSSVSMSDEYRTTSTVAIHEDRSLPSLSTRKEQPSSFVREDSVRSLLQSTEIDETKVLLRLRHRLTRLTHQLGPPTGKKELAGMELARIGEGLIQELRCLYPRSNLLDQSPIASSPFLRRLYKVMAVLQLSIGHHNLSLSPIETQNSAESLVKYHCLLTWAVTVMVMSATAPRNRIAKFLWLKIEILYLGECTTTYCTRANHTGTYSTEDPAAKIAAAWSLSAMELFTGRAYSALNSLRALAITITAHDDLSAYLRILADLPRTDTGNETKIQENLSKLAHQMGMQGAIFGTNLRTAKRKRKGFETETRPFSALPPRPTSRVTPLGGSLSL